MAKVSFSILLASVLLHASNYEIIPMIGYTFPNGGQEIRDHTVFAAKLQYNGCGSLVKPELSVMSGDVDRNDEFVGDVDIFRTAANGVYEFQKYGLITLFIKAGLGYETMSDHLCGNHNGVFVDGGIGVKIPLTEQIALKLEAIEMQKYNHSQWDNNMIYLAGFSFAFN